MTDSTRDIDKLLKQIQEQELPPVHLWHPEVSGEIDIRIARNGDWFHEGTRIQRLAMVRLFSRVLRRDGDDFFLVTPVEKLKITVEDAPFTAISMEVVVEEKMQLLIFTTNVGDQVVAGKHNPIFVHHDKNTREPSPYIAVRNRLNARIIRSVYYQLADYCEEQESHYTVSSNAWDFRLGPIES